MPSRRYEGTLPRIRAVLRHRALYEIGGELDIRADVGRPRIQPPYVLCIFGTLARVAKSTVRVETDLQDPDLWAIVRSEMIATIQREHLDLPLPSHTAPGWHHWRRFRDEHLATDTGLARLSGLHIPRAVTLARSIGLIDPRGTGTLTHPSSARSVYGDGTIVRPLYRPPDAVRTVNNDGTVLIQYADPATGELIAAPRHRYDPDTAEHHGHSGSVQGHGYVAWHVRGPGMYQRVILALDHIPHPGQEAATAVRLLADLHRAARDGIQVVVYDGALRGVHIDEIMNRFGYLVISNQPEYSDADLATAAIVKTINGRAPSIPLRTFHHPAPIGGTCAHTLAAVNGRAADIDLDERGDPVVRSFLARGAVKRAHRRDGRYHINIGYRLTCKGETHDVWLSPHAAKPGDPRPENLRVFPDGDPETLQIRGLRNDSESVHSQFKRTLITDRAMALGWRRGLIDYYCFAWYNNALTEARSRSAAAAPGNARRQHRAHS